MSLWKVDNILSLYLIPLSLVITEPDSIMRVAPTSVISQQVVVRPAPSHAASVWTGTVHFIERLEERPQRRGEVQSRELEPQSEPRHVEDVDDLVEHECTDGRTAGERGGGGGKEGEKGNQRLVQNGLLETWSTATIFTLQLYVQW